LLIRSLDNGLDFAIEASVGFPHNVTVGHSMVETQMIKSCQSQAETMLSSEADRTVLCVPVKQPPESLVRAILYFENGAKKNNLQKDEVFAIEALASRAGAELALLAGRLICKKQRILPTSDLVDGWSGVRKAGLEAFQAGVQDMALSFLERSLAMAEEWGPCRELATSLNDYGQVLRGHDRLQEAEQQFERGLSILEQAGLDQSPHAIPLLNNLAGIYYSNKEFQEAERLYRLSLDIMSTQEKESRAAPAVMANLGVISKAMGDPSTAKVWLDQALASSTRVFGENHPHTLTCREKLQAL